MNPKATSPRHWQRWLDDTGVGEAIDQHLGQYFREARRASEQRPWFVLAGGVLGALLGVAAAAVFVRAALHVAWRWPTILLVALLASVVVALLWWLAQRFVVPATRIAGRSPNDVSQLATERQTGRVLELVAEGLAKSDLGESQARVEADQLTQATIMMGLREAPVAELERQLLERLGGSAFVPTAEGTLFVFRLGPTCARCDTKTRTGPLRLLNLPAHWASANDYQRLKVLPPRGRQLPVVLDRSRELGEFLDSTRLEESRPRFFAPKTEIFLCQRCSTEAVRLGLLRAREGERE
jgi:membrane protein implicated in regulation of membrane protease activity